ncbi:MAG: sulfate adenylyltransferase subunit 1 [Acidimicrobiales bacterium]
MDLLRFAAVGSVDDGKSTLIGRLLTDSRQLFDDQIEAIEEASRRRGHDGVDLAFVTDGLKDERDQGITIDVAYRYAATPRRKFVIADCPGHFQYTRNMATGASTADLALVVVDARQGMREQTRRHLCIAALLGVRHFLVAVNKMDLVDWDQSVFEEVAGAMTSLAQSLGAASVECIPISALLGDNVASASTSAHYYHGPSVLEALENAPTGTVVAGSGARLPVQWVLRHPGGGRSYAGMINGGPLSVGDEVVVLPSGQRSRIGVIENFDGPMEQARASLSVAVRLEDDLDVSRGDLLALVKDAPVPTRSFEATLCWFAEQPLGAGTKFRIKHTTRVAPAVVAEISSRLDVNTMVTRDADKLEPNDIGVVRLDVGAALALDDYRVNRITGSFVLIDELSNATVAAGMVGLPVPALDDRPS